MKKLTLVLLFLCFGANSGFADVQAWADISCEEALIYKGGNEFEVTRPNEPSWMCVAKEGIVLKREFTLSCPRDMEYTVTVVDNDKIILQETLLFNTKTVPFVCD